MGARGPLPKSGETRRREGNPAHRPLPTSAQASSASGVAAAFEIPERPRGISAAAVRLWDLYAPELFGKGAFRPAWVPGLAAACEFESELLRDERQYSRDQRKAQKKAKAAGVDWGKSKADWLEKRELLARRRVLAQMKEQFVLTPKADSRFSAGEGAMSIPSGAMMQQQGMSEIDDPFSVVQ